MSQPRFARLAVLAAQLMLAACNDHLAPEPATVPAGGVVYPQPSCNPDNGKPCRGYR